MWTMLDFGLQYIFASLGLASLQDIIVPLGLVAMVIALIRSPAGGGIINAWCTISMTLQAIVLVPWGVAMLALGLFIIWHWGGWFGWLAGGWLVLHGGNCLFGSLAGFASSDSHTTTGAKPATRADLRRAGVLKR
jgi:hypothetical protein